MHRVISQVLWLPLCFLKGLKLSILKANLKFLASSANSRNSLSIALHWAPSVGCLSILSTLRSSLCHRNNFALSLLLNKRFKRGIIGAYHMTLAEIFFLLGRSSSSTSSGSSRLILYRDALHTRHASIFLYSSPRYRMQSLGHACIFWIFNPKG